MGEWTRSTKGYPFVAAPSPRAVPPEAPGSADQRPGTPNRVGEAPVRMSRTCVGFDEVDQSSSEPRRMHGSNQSRCHCTRNVYYKYSVSQPVP